MEFKSFHELSKHVAGIMVATPVVCTASLVIAAKEIKKELNPMPGHYQGADGPFGAWAPLAAATQDRRVQLGYAPDEPLLRDGTLRDSYTVKSGPMWAGVGSELEKALALEVGNPAKNLPARSLLGMATLRAERRAFAAFNIGIATLLTYGAGALMRVQRLTNISATGATLSSLR